MVSACCIVPVEALNRLSADPALDDATRRALRHSAELSERFQDLRQAWGGVASAAIAVGGHRRVLRSPALATVYDCANTTALPGSPIDQASDGDDGAARRLHAHLDDALRFYAQAFGRNSLDDAGITIAAAVHYGDGFDNALWTGSGMVCGDGSYFEDLCAAPEIVGHELAHGLTQYTLQLGYTGEAGGLNESLSDCFGSMFRQWLCGQEAHAACWLIGDSVMSPAARARGTTCLRDMAAPDATHCLAPQPSHYGQLTGTMAPHYSSGPANLAFCLACAAAGGCSWENVGRVWYEVVAGSGPHPGMDLQSFASRTREAAGRLFGFESPIARAVHQGWYRVGL